MEDNENNINNSSQNPINEEIPKSKPLNNISSIKGIISKYKEPQIIKIEKILSENKIPHSQPSLNEILSNKDEKFTQEYYNLNNLYSSIDCYIKIFTDYDRGYVTVNNNKIQVELDKDTIKLKNPSYSDISQNIIRNQSTQKELPNYLVNDTVVKIITGKKYDKQRKNRKKYILDINLDLVTCQLNVHKEKQKCRLILLGFMQKNVLRYQKVIKFNCVNVEKPRFVHFCNVLNRSIILSEGYKINKFGINFNQKYYTKSAIDVLNFVRKANTGDILLFKYYAKKNFIQRKILGSEYNHISLVIKNNNKMQLYDCIQDNNIRLLDFVDCLSMMWNLGFKKVAWRKLNINIEDMENYIQEYNIDKYENIDMYQLDKISANEIKKKFYQIINQKLENFINMNRNAKYEFSICKYLCNSKEVKNNIDLSRKKKYFCSELIASIYMYCNIMEKKFDPSTYLPKDFTEKGKIEFINGFHFGEETIIDFSN